MKKYLDLMFKTQLQHAGLNRAFFYESHNNVTSTVEAKPCAICG